MRQLFLFLAVLWVAAIAACGIRAHAQTPSALQAPESVTTRKDEAPALSELDKVKIENLNLMRQLAAVLHEADACRGALAEPRATVNSQQLQAAEAQLRADVEKAHPGYDWDPRSGTFTKKPPAPTAPPK